MITAIALALLCFLSLPAHCGERSGETYVEVEGPTVSPRGHHVVFSVDYRKADKALVRSEVLLLDLRTHSTKTLLRTKRTESRRSFGEVLEFPVPYAEGWYGFSWSPDGKGVFCTVVEGGRKGWNVWKLPVEKGKAGRVCRLRRGLCQRPRVSPDGKWIVFYDATTHDLFRTTPDGSGLKRLTETEDTYRLGFDWGTAGKHIYYGRGYMREDKVCGIWKMHADGSGESLVLDGYGAYNLAVSPSGKHLAFCLVGPDIGYRLFVHRIGGGKPTLVSEQAGLYLRWHSRSDVLFYTAEKGLYEWQASTGLSRKLVSAEWPHFPAPAPDGKTVLFLKKEGKSTFLWKLDVPSGKTEQLFPPAKAVPRPSPQGETARWREACRQSGHLSLRRS